MEWLEHGGLTYSEQPASETQAEAYPLKETG